MNLRYLLPILCFLIIWNSNAEAQQFPVTHYTPDSEINALPSSMVTHVHQDRQGFIWMSLFSIGLMRYDGTRMELYDQQDGLNDLGIWNITEDLHGFLWISTNAGLFVSEKPLHTFPIGERIRFTNTLNGTSLYREALTQNQIVVDTDGYVWIGTTAQGIFRYRIPDTSEMEVDQFSTDFLDTGNLSVIALYPDQTVDGVAAALENGDLYQISDNGSQRIFNAAADASDLTINSLFIDSENNIWAIRQNGEILVLRSGTTTPELVTTVSPSNITGIHAIREAEIWISSGEAGITKINPETFTVTGTYSRISGLLSNNIFHVMEDREGNIWIAQSGGLSKLRYNYYAFQNFSAQSQAGENPVLPSGRVNTIQIPENENAPCRIWTGTEGGLACIFNNGASRHITQDEGLTGNWVNGLSEAADGTIWIATTQGLNGITFNGHIPIQGAAGIREIDLNGISVTLFSVPGSPPFIAAETLILPHTRHETPVKTSWFPGLRSLYVIHQNLIFSFDASHGLPATLYKSVALDDEGYIWVGTLDRGLYKSSRPVDAENRLEELQANPDSTLFTPVWTRETGAPTNHIEKLMWWNGYMWVGTQDGLFTLNPETADVRTHIHSGNGLPADNAISFDISPASGNFWVGTNRGLSELDPESGRVLQTINRQDGLIDNEVWLYGSVKTDSDRLVYFGTANGLTIFHPHHNKPNDVPPILQMVSAVISYPMEGRNEAVFDYAALSFSNISQVQYQTRLRGYEDNWSQPNSDVRLRYTNLPAYFWPKEYTLEIRAANESGVWSEEPLVYSFLIKPVWWLSWWAFLIYLVVFSIGVFFIDRVQRSRLIKKERDAARLREAELKAETAMARSKAAEAQAQALKAENERKAIELEKARELEKAYHELQSAQKQLIQAEKMASLGRLSAGIAHEIKNPLNFINNFAGVSVELVEELIEAMQNNDMDEVEFLINNLKHNTSKIEEHGKRADSIVRSMMQHARGGKAEFEVFDLNNLTEKYVNLAYHGKKSQAQNFYAEVHTHFDNSLKPVKIVGQEIGQVLLNIIGNSLDAVWDHKLETGEDYQPEISVITRQHSDMVEVRISDNGPGVPEEIKERIFEPFFTTKPTGEGTGLGLSISYDIITQGHNGSLVLENNENGGASFIIMLPSLNSEGRKNGNQEAIN